MRTRTVTERIGEDMGPIDWSHPMAKDKPGHWRDAEQNPDDYEFLLNGMFTPHAIVALRMYDGWPYWKPTPAILRESPIGGVEWVHFNSYGVSDNSISRKRKRTETAQKRMKKEGTE